jgi:hypothetical protein
MDLPVSGVPREALSSGGGNWIVLMLGVVEFERSLILEQQWE